MPETVLDRLVRETLTVYAGQDIDLVTLALGESLARILVETQDDPEVTLVCLAGNTRRWLASGILAGTPLAPRP